MRLSKRSAAAFTLVEMMVAVGASTILGGVAFTLLILGTTLYTQNVSIGQTHSGGLEATEKLLVKVAAAEEVPVLVDGDGAPLAGNPLNVPAAGIRFYSRASLQAYLVPAAVNASATAFTITAAAGQPAPQVGDEIKMSDLGFRGVITSVTAAGNNYTVGGPGPVGIAIPPNSKCFLLPPSAFISVNKVLRYYPRALSVAQQGAPAFNDPASFTPISTLLPVGNLTNSFPFQYLDANRRSIDVNLRLSASASRSRITDFYTFQNMKTTVAYRSAIN